ncbi:uncharacterized protein LOC112350852 [Selaginella moellendorffii]|uniref:uncharacterized protein LOC112350852 n=1 Tax=Selaginella moellendorffii TaxID=88036 RepID=UPI000D1C228E|nr:uncharacterized protein LOC112350852 [Selaginella moellendorffii]|eukprot:XP_024543580.1 uncharacterized protein LOC112350852 [Selaginella moellendorffii]
MGGYYGSCAGFCPFSITSYDSARLRASERARNYKLSRKKKKKELQFNTKPSSFPPTSTNGCGGFCGLWKLVSWTPSKRWCFFSPVRSARTELCELCSLQKDHSLKRCSEESSTRKRKDDKTTAANHGHIPQKSETREDQAHRFEPCRAAGRRNSQAKRAKLDIHNNGQAFKVLQLNPRGRELKDKSNPSSNGMAKMMGGEALATSWHGKRKLTAKNEWKQKCGGEKRTIFAKRFVELGLKIFHLAPRLCWYACVHILQGSFHVS